MSLLQKVKDNCQAILAIVAVGGLLSGSLAYFAKAEDLRLVEMRLQQKITADRLYETRKQIWALEEQNRKYSSCNEWPDARDRKKYKELKTELEDLQKDFDRMKK